MTPAWWMKMVWNVNPAPIDVFKCDKINDNRASTTVICQTRTAEFESKRKNVSVQRIECVLNSLWAPSLRDHVKQFWNGPSKIKSKRNNARKKSLTRTWFEHATFWSGVRRATIAPPGLKKFRESLRLDLVSVWTFRNLCLLCHSLFVFAFLNLSGLLAAVKDL